jgi:hypothetical protein
MFATENKTISNFLMVRMLKISLFINFIPTEGRVKQNESGIYCEIG